MKKLVFALLFSTSGCASLLAQSAYDLRQDATLLALGLASQLDGVNVTVNIFFGLGLLVGRCVLRGRADSVHPFSKSPL